MTNKDKQFYTTLKPGDVRQKGDLVLRKPRYENAETRHGVVTEWANELKPTNLVGHPVLASDLIVHEYYRP